MVDEKVVLITGCSSGFGREMMLHLSQKGYQVVATLRNPAKTDPLKQEISDHRLVDIQVLDVTKPETIQAVFSYVQQQYGRLDCLINNAGFGMAGFFYDLTVNEYRDIMETNFIGIVQVTRMFLSLLMETPDSCIINISSVAGLTTIPGMSPYNASKWAVEAFSECLRMELKPFGVKVCAIEPGPYPTPILGPNTHFAKTGDNFESPFYLFDKRLKRLNEERVRKLKSDPKEVAVLAEKLIKSKNPKLRNPIGPTAKLRANLHRFMPIRWYLALFRRIVMGK